MPTAAKLVAAIGLAMVAFAAATHYYTFLPEGTRATYFAPVCALIGAYVGWREIGGRAGRGMAAAFWVGIFAAILLYALALSAFSIRDMLLRATRGHFDGLMDALTGTISSGTGFVALSMEPLLWAIVIGGGALTGLVSELVSRHWR